MTPRVSVLLPARDAAATLADALDSVLRQTERRLEVVLVDDGSHDASPEIARRFAARDPRVRVVAGTGRGLVDALGRGLAACRAPVVARMDADDVMAPERLARQLRALDGAPHLDAVGCHVRFFPRDALSGGMRAYEAWLASLASADDVARERFVECPVAHPTLAIRSAVLRGAGYRDRGWPEDYDLVLRLLAAGRRIGVVPEPLHAWRDGPDRLSRRSPVYGRERFVACKAAFLAEGLLARTERYVLWGYGGTGRALHRALRAHGRSAARIVELHPGRLGNRIHGALVVPPAALEGERLPIVASVSGAEARARIRACLARMGFVEQRDFLCAA